MMHWQYNPYVLPLLIAAAVSAALAFFAWRRRPASGATPLALLMLAVAEWTLVYALEVGSPNLQTKHFWAQMQYLGIVTVPVAWLAFVLQYTGRGKWLTRRNMAVLAVEPLLILLLVQMNDSHKLIWRDTSLIASGFPLDYTYGVGFWVNIAYSYLLLLIGIFLLLQALVRSPRVYRRQVVTLLIGALAPWVGNALYVSGLSPFPHLDLTPFAFTLSGLAATWALFRFRLLDIVPVARDAVIESMGDGVMVLDAQNRIVDLNPAAQRIINRSAAEAIGHPAAEVLSGRPDLVERYRDVTEAQAEIVLGEGEAQRYFDLRIWPLYDRRDRFTGRLVVLRDVTERKQMEEEMRESEEKYRVLAESSPNGIFISGAERFIYVNQRLCEITGFSGDELLNMPDPVGSLFAPEERERVLAYAQSRLRGGSAPTCYEARGIRKDGEEISLELTVSSIVFSGRRVLQGTVEDVTERKRAEEALRESEERFRAIFETAQDSIFIKDRTLKYTQVNPAMERLFGLPVSKLIGRTDEDLFGEEAASHIREVDSRVLSREIVEEEHTKPVEGIPKTFHIIKVPMRDGSGEIIGLCGIARDITERKRAEETLRRRAEEMDVLQATVLDITARHDLPTLLQTIVERAALLLDAPGGGLYLCDPDQKEVRCVVSYNTPRDYTGTVLKYGEGAAGIVAQTREPLVIDDYRTWSGRAAAFEEEQPFTAVLSAPMIWQGQVTGVIHVLHDVETRRFTQADLELLTLLANHAAIAIENARLYQETQQRALEQETLREAALALTTALDRSEVIERILAQLQQVVPYDSASVQLLQEDRLVIIGGHGFPNLPDLLGITFPADGDNPNSEVIRTRAPFIVEDAPAVYEAFREDPHRQAAIRSWLGVPLLVGEQLVGMIALDKRELGFYTQQHARLAQAFAAQAAIAIENARLFKEIEERRVYIEGVLGAAPDAIITLDDRFQVVEWNVGAERLFGYSREEAVGQHLDHLVTNPDVFEEAIGFTQRVLGGKELPPTEAVRYRKDGSPVDVIVAGSPILVGDELIGVVAVYTDITARVRMEETLRALALLDELTDLYNRRGFFTLGQQQLKAADRAKRRMLLLFADFNGLKRINDAFGHPEGDRALIETADVLRETFRESDIIARIGGDEFVVLAIETNGSPAEVLMHRLQEKLEARNAREGRRYELSLSVGIAHYDPEHPCSIDELVAQADRAMYERKRG